MRAWNINLCYNVLNLKGCSAVHQGKNGFMNFTDAWTGVHIWRKIFAQKFLELYFTQDTKFAKQLVWKVIIFKCTSKS